LDWRISNGGVAQINLMMPMKKKVASGKWQAASGSCRALLGEQMRKVISVYDREADIFDYLENKQLHAERYVVRGNIGVRLKSHQKTFASPFRTVRILYDTES
jgi:hypothetical protein